MKIHNFYFTRHFSFCVKLLDIGRGENTYVDYSISLPPAFVIPDDDISMITELFIDMIKDNYNVPYEIIEPITNVQYLTECGLEFYDE